MVSRGHGLDRFAHAFADAGFVVLLHDHRGFGYSGGEPRQDVNPWVQIEDWRRAISYLVAQPEVDRTRIGVWGTSYAGGHVLVLGATDDRVACVVSQVPTTSGYEQGLRRVPPDGLPGVDAALSADEEARAKGEPARVQWIVSANRDEAASYRAEDAIDFYLQDLDPDARWDNEVTVRSGRWARMYEPGVWAARIGPKPLLMVIATHDTITLTDRALETFERAHEPKKLVMIPGGHFDPYLGGFAVGSAAAVAWFEEHLRP